MQAELFILSLAICKVLSNCSPKNVLFVGFEKKPKRSHIYVIEATAEKCPGMQDLYYEWEIKQLEDSKVVQTAKTPAISINGYSYSSDTVFKSNFSVTVKVSHHPDMSSYSTTSDSFRFNADKMHIEIKGGTEKTHAVDTDLEVNAKALSTDTSFPPNEDAFEGNTIRWTIVPAIPGFTAPESLVITVPGSLLKLDQVYEFTVDVVRKKIFPVATERATQTVRITPPEVPELNLECLRNCENPNFKEKTAFRVVCSTDCHELSYKWTLTPSIGKDKLDFGDGFSQIVIQPGVFKEGDALAISVKGNSGISSYLLNFTEPMKIGTCDITPKEGVSGITVFKIKCTDFYSTNGNLIYMIYQKDEKTQKGVMLNEGRSSAEIEVFLSEASSAEIIVKVLDDVFLQGQVQLNAQVKPFIPQQNISKMDAAKTLILDDELKSVISLSLERKRNDAIQAVSYLLNFIDGISTMKDEVKRDLHKHMAESLLSLKPYDYATSVQMISILMKFEKFRLKTDTHTARLIGKCLEIASRVFHNIASPHNKAEESSHIPQMLLKETAEDIFLLASQLLTQNPTLEKTLEEETPVHDYESYDDMSSPKLLIREDLKDVTETLGVATKICGHIILSKTIPDEKPLNLKNDFMDFYTRKIRLTNQVENQTITAPGADGSKVFMPKPLIGELRNKFSIIDYQFAIINKSPFWWHKSHSVLNTDIILFDIFHNCHKIGSTKNSFHVHLKTKNVPTGTLTGEISSGNDIVAHRINLIKGFQLIVKFDSPPESFKAVASKCYCKKSDFDKGILIQSNSTEEERTLKVPPSNENNIYVCVLALKASLRYEASFAMFSCVFWNFKTSDWDSSGCGIRSASLKNNSFLVCACKHASFFSGQISAPSNRINLNLEFDFHIELLRNWITPVFLLIMLLLLGLLLTAAWYADKKFEQKNFICQLDDNVPGDSHVYLIVVVTGVYIDGGTTADVAFQLIGTKARSRVHLIKSAQAPLLTRNSQDWFVIYTPTFLGSVKRIRLWHNCRGVRPHWYCKRIIVEHLKSGQQYCFLVEKWLSLVWGSGKIYQEVYVSSKTYLRSNKILFYMNLESDFKEKHIWASIFTRDVQSNFTSMERAGAAAAAFFLCLLANSMFHGIPRNIPLDSIDSNSSYFISFQDIVIFIESFLISVPVSAVLVYIFNSSAPRHQRKNRKSLKIY